MVIPAVDDASAGPTSLPSVPPSSTALVHRHLVHQILLFCSNRNSLPGPKTIAGKVPLDVTPKASPLLLWALARYSNVALAAASVAGGLALL